MLRKQSPRPLSKLITDVTICETCFGIIHPRSHAKNLELIFLEHILGDDGLSVIHNIHLDIVGNRHIVCCPNLGQYIYSLYVIGKYNKFLLPTPVRENREATYRDAYCRLGEMFPPPVLPDHEREMLSNVDVALTA